MTLCLKNQTHVTFWHHFPNTALILTGEVFPSKYLINGNLLSSCLALLSWLTSLPLSTHVLIVHFP